MSISVNSADQFLNFAISIATMQFSKMPYFQAPNVLWGLRGSYILSLLIQLAFYFYIRSRIVSINDQRKIKIKKEASLFRDAEVEEDIEMTHSEYDMNELVKSSRSSLLQFFIVLVIHFKWNVVQPLIVQSFAPFRLFFLNPLYTAYVWNKPVVRPFELNMLFQKLEVVAPAEKKKREVE